MHGSGNGQHRAGRLVQQPQGYAAFIPKALPPDPPLRIGSGFQALSSEVDQALGRLDGVTTILPNVELFVLMYVRREAVLSSQIEGTRSTIPDVLAAEANIRTPDQPGDVEEVINYIRAMRFGIERLGSLPLCVRLLRELHEILLKGVRGNQADPGMLRRSQNWIGPPGCTLRDAKFVPPPPGELASALSDWEKFLHQASNLPAIVQAGLAHAQFENIHPFLDGNGRVGRLFITLFLCEREILLYPVLYLSSYLRANRTEYFERLHRVTKQGDWEGWVEFFLKAVKTVCTDSINTTRAILQLREDHNRLVSDKMGRAASNGLRILNLLYRRPVFQVPMLVKDTGLTYSSVNGLVARLRDLEILHETTSRRRHRVFYYKPYMELFSDAPL